MSYSKISRYYSELSEYCLPGKVLVIFGPRQAGKTTLLKTYLNTCRYRFRLDSGDNILLQELFRTANFDIIRDYVAGYELIAIDEAQMIPNIGQCLKIMVDQTPDLRVIVTGSSSFELAGQVGEPLTGRKRTITLYPIAQIELANHMNRYDLKAHLSDYLIYGAYPEVITTTTIIDKQSAINEIMQSYLFKDILTLDKIKNPKTLIDLLRLLAFQVGSEVSFSEIAQKLMIDTKTVARYLDLLEKSFVVYNLRGFSRNLRHEMTKKSKYYFYDNGIRNALIANFNTLDLRNDIGQLWENFLMMERIKKQSYEQISVNRYFWRTWEKKELDLIEEREGHLFAYEFKWKNKTAKAPAQWLEAYPDTSFEIIHSDNYLSFLF